MVVVVVVFLSGTQLTFSNPLGPKDTANFQHCMATEHAPLNSAPGPPLFYALGGPR